MKYKYDYYCCILLGSDLGFSSFWLNCKISDFKNLSDDVSGIPGRVLRKLYAEFQLKKMVKELGKWNVMMEIQVVQMDVAIKDNVVIVVWHI